MIYICGTVANLSTGLLVDVALKTVLLFSFAIC